MIGSPDLLAFTTETDFLEQSTESLGLPADLSVPLYLHSEDFSPWSKTSSVSFNKDFILISEFSEQVGPQPLLTIPDTTACGSFDLNHFSLRIMSVDYQTTFAGPAGYTHAKLNFVEDSKVVLGDSREGAYAYVHHLTLYDLEARGFVRPFCMAYVSSEEEKIMHRFRHLSAMFSKASECLKTGNRKNFANEVDKKLSDLEYTRLILLGEMNRDGLSKVQAGVKKGTETNSRATEERENKDNRNSGMLLTKTEEELKEKERCRLSFMEVDRNDRMPGPDKRGNEPECDLVYKNKSEKDQVFEQPEETKEGPSAACKSVMWANKAEELAHVEKAIQEHRDLLKQITSYPNRKLRDPQFLPYEPDDAFHSLDSNLDPNMLWSPESKGECNNCSHAPLHTPQLVSLSMCRQFDKRLKNLDELCDEYFLQQALKQLHSIERSFRGDNSRLLSKQRTQILLSHLKSTNFLFEDVCDLEAEVGQQLSRLQPRSARLPPVSPLHSEPVSLDSYTSCVEMVPIRLELRQNGPDSVPTSPCDEPPSTPNFSKEGNCKNEEVCVQMKDSISSGESIEVLATEKSFKTHSPFYAMETVLQRPSVSSEGRKRTVVTQRTNSEDSIEVLNFTDSIIPDDLRASCSSAIYEETPEHAGEQNDDRMHSAEDVLVPQSSPSSPNLVINPSEPDMSLDLCSFGARSPVSEHGSFQDRPFLFTPDELSDCTSYRSLGSTGSTPSLDFRGEKSAARSRRKCARLGHAALNFLRQFPFARHAVYSLLIGRTVVVLGSEERAVRQMVRALTMYTPHLGRCRENIQPWTSGALQITDLLTWKLVGYNRSAFPSSLGMPPSLVRFSRYLSVLDVDQKTLRCPAYKGSLICPLLDARTHSMRGTTYFLYAQSTIQQLVSRAFLFTFSRELRHPSDPSVEVRPEHIFGEFHNDDLKIFRYLSDLITQHVTGTSPPVLRFSYTASTVFKI
ncbi:guanine nucleotide exchange protein smcr8b isoform X2 [Tachysurus fulvidraco]|uniref:guanine nucleotide exchange protein smcr8b isoform X2 n=1 Tax=Tachysurus fulvidraco TaxID=1234273 RepID=UPI001FEE896A|nr:guanine nucleotide exchange protein smcr8b isoform X2 [Tachysurus fulvidraco]